MKNILYYSWDEMIKNDAIESLINSGYRVSEYRSAFDKYDFDEKNILSLKKKIDNDGSKPDAIFSFNYFPDVSRVALEKGIPYFSWVYDNPHLTLESETLGNETNRVFLFDSSQVEKYRGEGIKNIFYSPLPAKIVINNNPRYSHDVSFVGTMYDGDKDQYGLIKNIPDKLKGRLDGIVVAQHLIHGCDIIDGAIKGIESEIRRYIKTSLGEHYRKSDIDIISDIMRKRVTMFDRIRTMHILGEKFNVDLYCEKDHPELPVKYKGVVANKELPALMNSSKVNLNISLRSIRKGIPLRVMQILGSGGFCLTDYKEDMDELFEDGRDIAWFNYEEEMIEKCDYYLKHDNERCKIAQSGQATAIKKLSFEKLMGDIFNKI